MCGASPRVPICAHRAESHLEGLDWGLGLGRGARRTVQSLGLGWCTSHAQERVSKNKLSRDLRQHLSRIFKRGYF